MIRVGPGSGVGCTWDSGAQSSNSSHIRNHCRVRSLRFLLDVGSNPDLLPLAAALEQVTFPL